MTPVSYSAQTWTNGVAGATPLSAARLTHIEDGIAAVDTVAAAAVPQSAVGIPDPAGAYPPIMRTPKWQTATTTVSQLQSGHGWVGSSGFTANDTSDFCIGTQSAKLLTAGTGLTYKMEKTGLSLDTTGKQIRLRVKLEGMTRIGNLKFLIGNDTGYAAAYTWDLATSSDANTNYVTDSEWIAVTLNFASAATTGSPTRTGIAAMKVTVADNNTGTGVTAHIQSVELVDEPTTAWPNGLVSICFDDNWDSVWTLAKPKLDAVGYRASHYLIDSLVGQSSRLTNDQILTMQGQGWEVCAHAHTNNDHTATFTGLTAAELDADFRNQVAGLRAGGFRGMGTAYPQGNFGLTTDSQSTTTYARRYFAYARTVFRRTMETFPPADLMRLRAQSGISSFAGAYAPSSLTTTTTGDLDKAKANHAWLILVFHKIVTTTPTLSTECLQSDFNAIIDKIVANGMDCMPVGDVLRYYG